MIQDPYQEMKLAGVIPLLLLLIAACGEGEVEGQFGICSDATKEEEAAVWEAHDAFFELGYELHCCVAFVRSPDQEVLEDTPWVELPEKFRIEARTAAEGWRGWYHNGVAFVRRYGEAEPYLESLLIHELAHAVGFKHGPAMKRFESQVKEQMHK
jgi:hypothetical protein